MMNMAWSRLTFFERTSSLQTRIVFQMSALVGQAPRSLDVVLELEQLGRVGTGYAVSQEGHVIQFLDAHLKSGVFIVLQCQQQGIAALIKIPARQKEKHRKM